MRGPAPPTAADVLRALEARSDPRTRQFHARHGAPANQFGVKMGDIRALAKSLEVDHPLALELWDTGNLEARLLATLALKPKLLSEADLERMTAEVDYDWLADWLMSYVTKQHPGRETLRQRWMASSHPWLSRAGWSLTAHRVVKDPAGLDPVALLDRIEAEMGAAPAPAQWTMNFTLAEIGIRFAEHRQRAVDIGEKLGVYRDYPCSKGCISPFAPTWINAMVARAG